MMATMNLAMYIGALIDSFKINGRCNLDLYSIVMSHLFLNFFI